MTTLKAFDEMMGQFLTELARIFPDEAVKTPMDCKSFMGHIGPWSGKIMTKDDSFFCEENEFVKIMNLQVIWKRDDCSETTRQAIWQYIQSLYMMGTTFSMFPPEMLSMIETAAESCANKMKDGGPMDERALAGMLGQMLGCLGPPPQRTAGRIRSKKSSR